MCKISRAFDGLMEDGRSGCRRQQGKGKEKEMKKWGGQALVQGRD